MTYRQKSQNPFVSFLLAATVFGGLVYVGRDELRAEIRDIMDPPRVFGPTIRPQPQNLLGPRPDGNFRNCAQAFAAGRRNIPSSDPSYRARMDGDGDGLACEPYR